MPDKTLELNYPTAGLTNCYVEVRHHTNSTFMLSLTTGAFSALPVTFPAVTEDPDRPGVYQATISGALTDGLYSWRMFQRVGTSQDRSVDMLLGGGGLEVASNAEVSLGGLQADVDLLTSYSTDIQYFAESTAAMVAMLAATYGYGAKWYVDKTNGSDANPGTFDLPFATIGKAVTMAVAGRHDVIIVFQAATAYAEQAVLNKDGLQLLLTGASCKLDPGAGATDDTLKVTAPNCTVSGAGEIMGRNGHRAVYAYNADGIVLNRSICRTDLTTDVDAVVIEECLVPVLGPELSCSHADGHGLVIKSTIKTCHWARVNDITAHQCGKDGIHIEGNVNRAIVRGCNVHDNAGYGIYAGGDHNVIDSSNRVHGNTLGDIYDATGQNKIYGNGTLALAVLTGAKDLGVEVATSFNPIVMAQGELRMLVFEMTEDGVPVDCTGFAFKLGVKGKITDAAYKIGLLSGAISAGSTGLQSLVTWTFTPAMTSGLSSFNGVYEVVLYDLSGNKVPLTARGGVSYTLRKALIP